MILWRCKKKSDRFVVGRIGNPSEFSGRITNPSYSKNGHLLSDCAIVAESGKHERSNARKPEKHSE
jgi:hypothetical protein